MHAACLKVLYMHMVVLPKCCILKASWKAQVTSEVAQIVKREVAAMMQGNFCMLYFVPWKSQRLYRVSTHHRKEGFAAGGPQQSDVELETRGHRPDLREMPFGILKKVVP